MATFPSLTSWLTGLNQQDPSNAWIRNTELGWGGAPENQDTITRALQTFIGRAPAGRGMAVQRNLPGLQSAYEAFHVANPVGPSIVDWLSGNGVSDWWNALTPFQAGRRNDYSGVRWT